MLGRGLETDIYLDTCSWFGTNNDTIDSHVVPIPIRVSVDNDFYGTHCVQVIWGVEIACDNECNQCRVVFTAMVMMI